MAIEPCLKAFLLLPGRGVTDIGREYGHDCGRLGQATVDRGLALPTGALQDLGFTTMPRVDLTARYPHLGRDRRLTEKRETELARQIDGRVRVAIRAHLRGLGQTGPLSGE
mgnify:CR=1 FL=1